MVIYQESSLFLFRFLDADFFQILNMHVPEVKLTILCDGTIRYFIICRSFEKSDDVQFEGEINVHFFPTNCEGTLRLFLNSDFS